MSSGDGLRSALNALEDEFGTMYDWELEDLIEIYDHIPKTHRVDSLIELNEVISVTLALLQAGEDPKEELLAALNPEPCEYPDTNSLICKDRIRNGAEGGKRLGCFLN